MASVKTATCILFELLAFPIIGPLLNRPEFTRYFSNHVAIYDWPTMVVDDLKGRRWALFSRHCQVHILAVIPWAFVGAGSETLQTSLTESVG